MLCHLRTDASSRVLQATSLEKCCTGSCSGTQLIVMHNATEEIIHFPGLDALIFIRMKIIRIRKHPLLWVTSATSDGLIGHILIMSSCTYKARRCIRSDWSISCHSKICSGESNRTSSHLVSRANKVVTTESKADFLARH